MPTIKRPGNKTVQFEGKISQAIAEASATSAAGIGKTLTRLGQIVGGIGVQDIQRGNAMIDQFVQQESKAKAAQRTAQLAEKTNQFSLEYAKQAQDRINQPVDKDGNPTFNSLPDDLGKRGKELINQMSSKIKDPKVRAKFKQWAERTVSNKQIQSLGVARKQRMDYTLSKGLKGIDDLIKLSVNDDPANFRQYTGRINKILSSLVTAGVITHTKAQKFMSETKERLITEQIRNQIVRDPAKAHEFLKGNQATSLGLKDRTFKSLQKQAHSAKIDREEDETVKRSEQAEVLRYQQNINASLLAKDLEDGKKNRGHVEAALKDGQIREGQAMALNKLRQRKARSTRATVKTNTKITEAITKGSNLSSIATESQVDKHYRTKIALEEKALKRPLTLTEKALRANQYKGPVKSFQKELGNALLHGDPKKAVESSRIIDGLSKTNPLAISKIDKQALALASTMKALLQNSTGLSDTQAYNIAKQSVMVKNDVYDTRRKNYKGVEEFKPKNLRETIAEDANKQNDDGFFSSIFSLFSSDKKDNKVDPKSIPDETLAAYSKLYQTAYTLTGNPESARNLVSMWTSGVFGNTGINGKNGQKFMAYPPELIYKGKATTQDLRADLEAQIKKDLPPNISAKDVRIRSDAETRRSDKPLSYGLYYMLKDKEGNEVVMPLMNEDGTLRRWTPSPEQSAQERQFNEKTDKMFEAEVQARKQAILNKNGATRLEKMAMTPKQILQAENKAEAQARAELKAERRQATIQQSLKDKQTETAAAQNTAASALEAGVRVKGIGKAKKQGFKFGNEKEVEKVQDDAAKKVSAFKDGNLDGATPEPSKARAITSELNTAIPNGAKQVAFTAKDAKKIENIAKSDKPSYYKLAHAFKGLHERKNAATLNAFFKAALGPQGNKDPRKTAWCAMFANSVLAASGRPTASNVFLAREFLKYGNPVETASAKEGDIVVFRRGKNPQFGHVGFYMGTVVKNGVQYIKVLGGNQRNSVMEKLYKASDLLGVRRPPPPKEIQNKLPSTLAASTKVRGYTPPKDNIGTAPIDVEAQKKKEAELMSQKKLNQADKIVQDYESGLRRYNIKSNSSRASNIKTISQVANEYQVPARHMLAIAKVESNFNSNAKARTSSATGLFQFTRATWSAMVRQHGNKTGIKLSDIKDPRANATMAALLYKQLKTSAERAINGTASVTHVYMLHFLGQGGGSKFLRTLKSNPNAPIESAVSASAIRANRSVLRGTVSDVFNRFKRKLGDY